MKYLSDLPAYQAATHVACYMSYKDECLTDPLILQMRKDSKSIYLPVSLDNNMLNFVLYKGGDALVENKFGILEPSMLDDTAVFDPAKLDLVILPLVAFNSAGHRLGAGGGYYDRTFASVQPKPFMLGYGFSIQQAEELPSDAWDVSLDAVLTEDGLVYKC